MGKNRNPRGGRGNQDRQGGKSAGAGPEGSQHPEPQARAPTAGDDDQRQAAGAAAPAATTTDTHGGARPKTADSDKPKSGEEHPAPECRNEPEGAQSNLDVVEDTDTIDFDKLSITDVAMKMCRARLMAKVSVDKIHRIKSDRSTNLGIKEDALTTAFEGLVNRLVQMEADEIMEVMKRLWDEQHVEFKKLAMKLLTHAAIPLSRYLGFEELFKLIRHLIVTHPARELIDQVAKSHLNSLAYLEPPETWLEMDRWAKEDEEPWLQRAAILHQIHMGAFTNKDRLFDYCKQHFKRDHPHEDIINSAIYLALERYAAEGCEKTDDLSGYEVPSHQVVEFISAHLDSMPSKLQKILKNLKTELQRNIDDIKKKRRKQLSHKLKTRH